MRVEHHAVAHLAIFAAGAPQPPHPTSKFRMQKRACERRDQGSLDLKRRLQALPPAATAASAAVYTGGAGGQEVQEQEHSAAAVVRE